MAESTTLPEKRPTLVHIAICADGSGLQVQVGHQIQARVWLAQDAAISRVGAWAVAVERGRGSHGGGSGGSGLGFIDGALL